MALYAYSQVWIGYPLWIDHIKGIVVRIIKKGLRIEGSTSRNHKTKRQIFVFQLLLLSEDVIYNSTGQAYDADTIGFILR